MIRFKQYLTEIFDKPYEYNIKHTGNVTHAHFKSDKGIKYGIFVNNQPENKRSIAAFSGDNSFDETGLERNQSHRVYSTIKDVIKKHVEIYHPEAIEFSGSQAKQKLYTHLAKKSGVAFGRYNNGVDDEYTIKLHEVFNQEEVFHNISIEKLKSLAKDSEAHTARFVYHNNTLHGGDGRFHCHEGLLPGCEGNGPEGSNTLGFIHYIKNQNIFTHTSYDRNRNGDLYDTKPEHPLFQKFTKKGIVKHDYRYHNVQANRGIIG